MCPDSLDHLRDANRRLASKAIEILFQLNGEVPDEYREQFDRLRLVLEEAMTSVPVPGMKPISLKIQNRTAVKYIKLLIDMQYRMKELDD